MRLTTHTDKKVVVSILEKEMKIYDDFIKACEIIKEAAKKWDGKVFNARFINAVNKELEVIGGDKFAQFVKISRGFNGDGLELFNRDRYTEKDMGTDVVYLFQGDNNLRNGLRAYWHGEPVIFHLYKHPKFGHITGVVTYSMKDSEGYNFGKELVALKPNTF